MCKQQQLNVERTMAIPTGMATKPAIAPEGKSTDFLSCGLDRSCPTSVTTPQGQDVRLDQYQSNIGQKTPNRRRQRLYDGIKTATINTHLSPTASVSAVCVNSSLIPDHEFEWYDLDAIREVDNVMRTSDNRTVIDHDFNAGLVFTTERQVLSKGVEVNVVNSSASITDNKNGQESDFDLFFWVNNDHSKVGETPAEREEREFQERMEELEQEINCDLVSVSSSSFSTLSLLNDDEAKDEIDRDREGSFFASWRFGDSNIQ
mmetsp:Transcript_3193/g.7005  ORF Transcript_3193/g.7005 Transcript_3193/m.7005 type:complete len:261 (-) Transcript_3193:2009-2791(-)